MKLIDELIVKYEERLKSIEDVIDRSEDQEEVLTAFASQMHVKEFIRDLKSIDKEINKLIK